LVKTGFPHIFSSPSDSPQEIKNYFLLLYELLRQPEARMKKLTKPAKYGLIKGDASIK